MIIKFDRNEVEREWFHSIHLHLLSEQLLHSFEKFFRMDDILNLSRCKYRSMWIVTVFHPIFCLIISSAIHCAASSTLSSAILPLFWQIIKLSTKFDKSNYLINIFFISHLFLLVFGSFWLLIINIFFKKTKPMSPIGKNLCNGSFHGLSWSLNIAEGGFPPIALAYVSINEINVGVVSSVSSANPNKID